jgi:serine/threonine protein kinase/ankyrin repeat protein
VTACEQKDYESLKKFLQNKKVIKPMLSQLDANGCTPLQLAVSLGDIVVVDALLSAMDPGDVNAVDKFGNTALHEACKASSTKNDRVLEALLGAPGLDATLANADENTALHYFCQKYSTVNCAQLGARMLELGGISLVLKQNKNRETALHYAMFNPQFRLPMTRFLIKATTGELALGGPAGGASTSSNAASTQSPRTDSGGSGIGSNGGGEKNTTDDAGNLFLNAQNSKGETALHYGVRLLRPDVVQLLLGAGADHRLKNQAGESPRDLAEVLHKKGERSQPAAAAVTSGDPLPVIMAALDNAAYLREWLEQPSIELGRLVGNFVRGGVTRDELPELTETHLNDMGIKSAGPRIRIMKAIKELRKKESGSSKKRKAKKKNSVSDPAGGDGGDDSKRDSIKPDDPALEVAPSQPDFGSARMQSIKAQLEQLQYIKVDAGDWIDASTLEFLEELGSGACGTVMRGVYRHPKDGSVHPVAIKVLKEAETEKETEEFKKEFQILSAVKSPYMVHFFGACLHPQMAMVMELCSKGSVWKVLQTDSGIKVHWPEVLEWSVQLASGVAALHNNEPQIVHRDLKTLNLLLSDNWIIKVCDFGLSRFSTSSNVETLAKMRGTMAYCVPEEHEILTNRGFMDLETYTTRAAHDKGLLVASYDKRNDTMTFEKPQRLIVQPRQERMLVELSASETVDTWAEAAGDFGVVGGRNRVRNASGVSLLVTREHHLYAQFGGVDGGLRTTWADAPYAKIEAGDFLDDGKLHALRQKTAAASGYDGPNKPRSVADVYSLAGVNATGAASAPLALFYELYGYWLGDGAFDVESRVATFGNVRDVAWLRATLTALFGAEQWRVRADGATFEVLDARWNELIGEEYGRRFGVDSVDCIGDDKRALRAMQQRSKERGVAPRQETSAAAPLFAPPRRVAADEAVSSAAGSHVPCEANTSAKWTAWWVWTLDCEAVRGVIRGVQRADGVRAKSSASTTPTILTSSARFRDELVRLCYQAGYAVHFDCERHDAARDVWAVRWCDERASAAQREPLLHPVLQKARGEVRERAYTGRVWCFTMPSGFIWTRRVHKDERGVVTKASRALLTGQCPPEAYFGERFTDRSDLYSVAVILWEMANRCIKGEYNRPFYEFPNLQLDFQIIIQVARKSKRPGLPPSTPPALADLIQRCWQKDRDQRPTAAAVRDELIALQQAFEKDPAPWNAAYVGRAAEEFAKQAPQAGDAAAKADEPAEDPGEESDSELENKSPAAAALAAAEASATPAPAAAAPVAAAPAVEPTAAAVDKPSKLASSGSRKGSRRKSSAATGASGAVSPRSPLAEEGRRASSKRESAVAATDNDDDNDTGAANNNNNNDDDDDDEESGSGEASGSEEKPSAPQRATSEKRRRRVKRSLAKSGTAKE